MEGFLVKIRSFRVGIVTLIALLLASILVIPVGKNVCERALQSGAVLIRDSKNIAPGYVLMPISLVALGNEASGKVILVDSSGVVVHTWKTEFQPLVAYLQDNGDLLVGMIPPTKHEERLPDGTTGVIARLDWNSNVLWKYEDPKMNHDFDILPDGSIAYLRWSKVPPALHYLIEGGMSDAEQAVWANEIVVVNPEKEITWIWKGQDHIAELPRTINEITPDFDWIHANSLKYVAENPVTKTPAFLISMRNVSAVAFIDAATGEVIWNSPPGAFSVQHDATLLENGNILVFDNGANDKSRLYLTRSEAVEIAVPSGNEVWNYDGGTSIVEKLMFASEITSGAERLPNGNTLIILSMQGRIYEVTPEGTIAWQYTNDHRDDAGRFHQVFKARKYDPEGAAWEWRIPVTTPLLGALCR